MRLIIGDTAVRAKPAATAAAPSPASQAIFFFGAAARMSHCPARTPQIVWAAVGMALNATQWPAESSPPISMSTHDPKLWSGTKGWL